MNQSLEMIRSEFTDHERPPYAGSETDAGDIGTGSQDAGPPIRLGTPNSEASTIVIGSIEDVEMQIKDNAVILFPFAVEHFRHHNPTRIKGSDAFEVLSMYDASKGFRGHLIYRIHKLAKPAAYSVWCETKKEAFEKLLSLTKLNIFEDDNGAMEKVEEVKTADDDEWIYEYDFAFDEGAECDGHEPEDDDVGDKGEMGQ